MNHSIHLPTRSPISFHFHLRLVGLMLITVLVTTASVYAQEGEQSQADAATIVSGDITVDEVNEIAGELWCPLCSGVRLDACELKACDQMKDEIAIKLTEGDDLASIKSYFVEQYGPQVLGEPPREGFNLLAWILPVAVLLGGGIFLITRGRKLFRRPKPDEAGAEADDAEEPASEDPYTDQLEKELKQYD